MLQSRNFLKALLIATLFLIFHGSLLKAQSAGCLELSNIVVVSRTPTATGETVLITYNIFNNSSVSLSWRLVGVGGPIITPSTYSNIAPNTTLSGSISVDNPTPGNNYINIKIDINTIGFTSKCPIELKIDLPFDPINVCVEALRIKRDSCFISEKGVETHKYTITISNTSNQNVYFNIVPSSGTISQGGSNLPVYAFSTQSYVFFYDNSNQSNIPVTFDIIIDPNLNFINSCQGNVVDTIKPCVTNVCLSISGITQDDCANIQGKDTFNRYLAVSLTNNSSISLSFNLFSNSGNIIGGNNLTILPNTQDTFYITHQTTNQFPSIISIFADLITPSITNICSMPLPFETDTCIRRICLEYDFISDGSCTYDFNNPSIYNVLFNVTNPSNFPITFDIIPDQGTIIAGGVNLSVAAGQTLSGSFEYQHASFLSSPVRFIPQLYGPYELCFRRDPIDPIVLPPCLDTICSEMSILQYLSCAKLQGDTSLHTYSVTLSNTSFFHLLVNIVPSSGIIIQGGTNISLLPNTITQHSFQIKHICNDSNKVSFKLQIPNPLITNLCRDSMIDTLDQCCNALSVDLLSFSGIADEKVLLFWEAAIVNEQDAYFEVQRLENEEVFVSIGKVKVKENSNDKRYNFEDQFPNSGQSVYRLKIVDTNRNVKYSKLLALTYFGKEQDPIIYPTILGSDQNLNIKTPLAWSKDKYNLSIFDAFGRSVIVSNNIIGDQTLSLHSLNSGNYVLKLNGSNEKSYFCRFILK